MRLIKQQILAIIFGVILASGLGVAVAQLPTTEAPFDSSDSYQDKPGALHTYSLTTGTDVRGVLIDNAGETSLGNSDIDEITSILSGGVGLYIWGSDNTTVEGYNIRQFVVEALGGNGEKELCSVGNTGEIVICDDYQSPNRIEFKADCSSTQGDGEGGNVCSYKNYVIPNNVEIIQVELYGAGGGSGEFFGGKGGDSIVYFTDSLNSFVKARGGQKGVRTTPGVGGTATNTGSFNPFEILSRVLISGNIGNDRFNACNGGRGAHGVGPLGGNGGHRGDNKPTSQGENNSNVSLLIEENTSLIDNLFNTFKTTSAIAAVGDGDGGGNDNHCSDPNDPCGGGKGGNFGAGAGGTAVQQTASCSQGGPQGDGGSGSGAYAKYILDVSDLPNRKIPRILVGVGGGDKDRIKEIGGDGLVVISY